MPCKDNKELDGVCRAACAIRETDIVRDNTSSLLGAVKVVTCLIKCSRVHHNEKGNISETSDTDDPGKSIESETFEEE